MIPPRGNGNYSAKTTDLHWRRRRIVSRRAVPQFAVSIISPGPDSTVGLQCQTVGRPPRNGDDTAKTTDLHWRGASIRRAVPQLTIIIISPGPDSTVVFQREAVKIPRSNGDYTAKTTDLYRRRAIIICCAIPQLAFSIISPCPDRTVGLHGKTVRKPRS